jgi:hypothetical protein
MKKMILVLAIGLIGAAMAVAEDEENGALGFGIMSDSSDKSLVGGGFRGTVFLDAGTKLFGPFHYGFELQGDVKRLSQDSSYFTSTDVATYFYGNDSITFINSTNYTQTYTLWDADISPRGYLSFDLGNKIQLLGFLGLNYNWQTLDYELKTNDGSTFSAPDGSSTSDFHSSHTFGDNWSVLMGFRVSVGAFYLDYTRFLQANDTGGYAWNQFNKDRLSGGIDLRF